ncbi:GNAT family N-acetyltransferase [Marinomonas spartinae]|uniref:GNAT family N-acetyltransferase n=1 Tax=Marinomonas spartinae TaxID=1792290 RepID=UPI0018F1AD4D|nr:GNAT family N-acetyltransferase [Marinomonas spartinae]MBJ7555552.1 GNAT family N-acetyltransferase [Marinomonas spartinae]
MELRKAKLSDVDLLSPLFHDYRQLSVSLDSTASLEESKRWITDCLVNDDATFLLAIKEGRLFGFATLYKGFSSVSLQKYWILNDLYVTSDARGLGVGTLLMAKVDDYAVQTHSKGVELETSLDNRVAQSLYEKLGYLENAQYKRYFKKVRKD